MFEIERVRDYWNGRPCNIRHSPKEVGSKEYFDEVENRKYFVEPHIPVFAEFEKWKGKKILEIGCGLGTDTINFSRSGAEKIIAVDLSEKSLDLARKRAEVFGFKNIGFKRVNMETLTEEIPDLGFDLIYSFGAIHHTPSPETAIDQIKKLMKPHTTFKMMVYHKISWKVLWILLKYGKGAFWKLDKLIAEYSEAQTGCPVTYTYTKNNIRNLLRSSGFTIMDMWVDHIFPFSIPEYKQYQYKKVWYFRYLPKKWFRWLEKHFGWHLCVTAVNEC